MIGIMLFLHEISDIQPLDSGRQNPVLLSVDGKDEGFLSARKPPWHVPTRK
jgi:hypothetical protein